jgi:Na+-driven multidrug efflux pump
VGNFIGSNALANVVVQSNINAFGKMAVTGCGSYSKIEGFGFWPINCFVMALTTLISQNLSRGVRACPWWSCWRAGASSASAISR